jgi:hypothetical protein
MQKFSNEQSKLYADSHLIFKLSLRGKFVRNFSRKVVKPTVDWLKLTEHYYIFRLINFPPF